jgi:hypothetical protein
MLAISGCRHAEYALTRCDDTHGTEGGSGTGCKKGRQQREIKAVVRKRRMRQLYP